MTMDMGFPVGMRMSHWESHENGNKTYTWKWERFGIDCMGMEEIGN